MLTEEQAKDRWCPMVHQRVTVIMNKQIEAGTETVIEELVSRNIRSANCIASRCMMWVWGRPMSNEADKGFCGLSQRQQG